MDTPRRQYRKAQPGPLRLRESVRRALVALAGAAIDARLDVALVEAVERALRCELPDEILACFANGDDKLSEWRFNLGDVADHTALARELGCRPDMIAVGRHPDSLALYCIDRRGDRRRAVGLVEVETAGDTGWRDLGEWLAELAGLGPDLCPRVPAASVQLTLFPDFEPAGPESSRVWRLVT